MNDIISVIVPVYNVEQYIDKCINSIINQTYKNLEIILVDDGSTDNCPKICDNFLSIDSRIKVYHKKNGGLSDARNFGILKATGTYIAFVDSDDWIEKDMFEVLYKQLKKFSADMAICKLKNFPEDILEDIDNAKNPYSCKPIECLKKILFDRRYGNYAWNKLYKTELFDNVRYPTGKYYEDVTTTYKLILKSNAIAVIPKPYYNYYWPRKGSITNTGSDTMFNDLISSWLMLLDVAELKPYHNLIASQIYKDLFIAYHNNIQINSNILKRSNKHNNYYRKLRQFYSKKTTMYWKITFIIFFPWLYYKTSDFISYITKKNM